MFKSKKSGKDPTKILKNNNPNEYQEIPKEIKTLKQQIRNSISQVLDFNNRSTNAQKLIQLSSDTGLNPTELLKQWSDSVMTQLKKFTFKVNTIAQLNKNEQKNKLGQQISKKLQRCSEGIIQVIEKISLKEKWCLCKREKCTMRIQPIFTQQRVKNYVYSNLSEGIISFKGDHLLNVEQGSIDFFNVKPNSDCDLISLQFLNSNVDQKQRKQNKQQQQVIQFLHHLKIKDSQRSSCNIDQQWINILSQRKKQNGSTY